MASQRKGCASEPAHPFNTDEETGGDQYGQIVRPQRGL